MGLLKLGSERQLRGAGELLALEALDRTGLAVTSEGAFVRALNVTPPNPLILSGAERMRVARGYCHLLSRLRGNESLQFYVQSRPINLGDVLAQARREVSYLAGEPPSASEGKDVDALAVSRWRLYGAMEESLRLHADEQAAVQRDFYVICPYLPARGTRQELAQALLPRRRAMSRTSLVRDLKTHRRAARASLAFTEGVRSELDALSLPNRLRQRRGVRLAAVVALQSRPGRPGHRRSAHDGDLRRAGPCRGAG